MALAMGQFRVDDARVWATRKRIVFVCTGNICRSSYAEVAARALGLDAVSCGIDTQADLPADPTAVEEARFKGLDLTSHQTTRWEDVELRPGDIVVAMQLWHAKAVLPRAEKANCPVILMTSVCTTERLVIWDPYGRPREEFKNVFDSIDACVQQLAYRMEPTGDQHYSGSSSSRGRQGLKPLLGRAFKEVAGRILVLSGAHRRMLKGRAVVVAFHSITRARSHGALRCSVKDFERYCAFFSKHMKVAAFPALVDRLHDRQDLDGELSITFDDGYADNAELALPILNRHGLHATFYISTGFIESATQTPWDKKVNVRSRWMTWSQVAQLMEAGHEIGAHTVSHANLSLLTREETIDEVSRSREALIVHTAKVPKHFALPFGRSFPAIKETILIVRDLGFESFSLCRGGIIFERNNPMHIERWPINPLEYSSPYGWILDVLRTSRPSVTINALEAH